MLLLQHKKQATKPQCAMQCGNISKKPVYIFKYQDKILHLGFNST